MTQFSDTDQTLQRSDSIPEEEEDGTQALQKRYLNELRVLRDVALVGARVVEEDALLAQATQIIGNVFYPDNFGVLLLDEAQQLLIPHQSYHGSAIKDYAPVPLIQGITGFVARTGRSLVVSDVSQNAHYFSADKHTRSELCVPLIADDRLLGVVNAESAQLNAFTAADERLMITLAGQLATALQKIRLLEAERQRRAEAEAMREAARRHVDELELLSAVSSALRQASTVEAMLPVIVQKSREALAAVLVVVGLLDESGEAVVVRDIFPAGHGFLGRHFRLDEGIIGRVGQSRTTYVTTNLLADPLATFSVDQHDYLRRIDARSLISVPLQTSQNMLGVLSVILDAAQEVTPEKVQLIEAIAEIAAGALQRALILTTLEQRVQERTRELAAANERLQELDRLKSRFISDVSHELRTPITNLGLYMDLFEQGRPEKREHYWRVLRQQTHRLKFLIEDILRLSRLDVGREDLEFESVDLNGLVTEVVVAHRHLAIEKGLKLYFAPTGNLPQITGEPASLNQVVANLLENAIHYTPAGSVTVSTTFAESEGKVILQVADTGPGIAAEDQPHIFERFYRGWNPSTARAPGTGLGLSLVEEIVRLHGGEVIVESDPNRGATFTVRLPAI